ncbi:MAG: hypothetical protein AAFO73_12060 [Pseudomonadota bacterium]
MEQTDTMTEAKPNEPDMTGLIQMLTVGFCVGLFAGAVFQSQALVTLAYDLEPGPVADRVATLAETWHGLMQTLGIAPWVEGLSDTLESWRPTAFHNDG